MGRMGPGHTLMAKCSCIEILTGEAGGIEVEWGVAEGEEAEEEGLEVEEGGMARWVVEGGGGGLETLMRTVKWDCVVIKRGWNEDGKNQQSTRNSMSSEFFPFL